MSFYSFIESWYPYPTGVLSGVLNEALEARWTYAGFTSGSVGIDPVGGRRGNPAIAIALGSGLYKALVHSSQWVYGIPFKANNINVAGGIMLALRNCDQDLFRLTINSDGTFSFYAGAVLIGTTSNQFVFNNRWVDPEVQVIYSGTTNINVAVTCWINGNLEFTGNANSGVNKANLLSQTATTNVVALGSGMNGAGGIIVDGAFYIHNNQGAITGRWGDGLIKRVVPNGDTAQADWIPNSGSVHYNRVNELPKDDDTTYVSASTVGNKDAWDWEDIPSFSGLIRDVQVSMATRKDDEGAKAFRIGVGATLSEAQSDDYYVNDSYIYYHNSWDLDPATGLAWTRAGFNAKQFGPEVRV